MFVIAIVINNVTNEEPPPVGMMGYSLGMMGYRSRLSLVRPMGKSLRPPRPPFAAPSPHILPAHRPRTVTRWLTENIVGRVWTRAVWAHDDHIKVWLLGRTEQVKYPPDPFRCHRAAKVFLLNILKPLPWEGMARTSSYHALN